MSGSGVDGGWDAVYRFCSLCFVFLTSTEDRNGERGDVFEPGSVATPDGDFQLMYLRRFLRDAGEGMIRSYATICPSLRLHEEFTTTPNRLGQPDSNRSDL